MAASSLRPLVPGLGLSCAVALAALGFEAAERRFLGFAWIDGLVLAILIGTALHSIRGLSPRLRPGVAFAARTILEIAIVLLGASLSLAAIAAAGFGLAAAVAAGVVIALFASYAVARLLGLSDRLATLVACGNSICGNSAIAAAAPVIGADADEVAASIAFTAALGMIVVLTLPLLAHLLGLDPRRYGILAGMVVYAVPQVLAATLPVGLVSTQIGTLVKLMRVLMLGPVVMLLGLRAGRSAGTALPPSKLVPWFVLGFVAMAGARSAGLLPDALLEPLHRLSVWLTIIAMAALGLSVDIRTVMTSGGRVLAAGVLSLLVLGALGLAIARFAAPA